jgi:hypothetical protein
MTQVEIESILQHEDIQALLENAEPTGSVRQPELAELIELHQLDALETDALFNELERRGIEIVDEPEKEKERSRRLPAPDVLRDDDRRAAALPARGRPAPAADRRPGGGAREADRARRHGREDAHDPVEPAAGRLDREELPQPGLPFLDLIQEGTLG